ncbi:MAG: signal peptidase II [Rhodospirillaceae bacterium]|jgi:signal peptidase II|nr:signal peptidase II [Rhodospirillaceae bacterium]MBT5667220.1 signal peptidase II [Rhodospirillaceae bacterium]MBT5810296.1 signal peptidase II [Rhodospirillaceae bacterium]
MLRDGLIPAVAVALADQASKWWILLDVMNPPRILEMTPFFNIVLTFNRGVSFGLLDSDSPWSQPLLIVLAMAISTFLVLWLHKAESVFVARAIGLTLGGALGNVIDRFVHSGVVDFLDFHAFGAHWPAFNVADAAITSGVALLLFDALIVGRTNHR